MKVEYYHPVTPLPGRFNGGRNQRLEREVAELSPCDPLFPPTTPDSMNCRVIVRNGKLVYREVAGEALRYDPVER